MFVNSSISAWFLLASSAGDGHVNVTLLFIHRETNDYVNLFNTSWGLKENHGGKCMRDLVSDVPELGHIAS